MTSVSPAPPAAERVVPGDALIFRRASRSGGPDHQIQIDPVTFRPLGCSCQAGRQDVVCWAALDVAATDAYDRALEAYVAAGRVYGRYSAQHDAAWALWQRAAARRRVALQTMDARQRARGVAA